MSDPLFGMYEDSATAAKRKLDVQRSGTMTRTFTTGDGHLRLALHGPVEPRYLARLLLWAQREGLTITETGAGKPNLASQDSSSNQQASKFAPKSPRGSVIAASPEERATIEAARINRATWARLSGVNVRTIYKQHELGRYSPAVLRAARELLAEQEQDRRSA